MSLPLATCPRCGALVTEEMYACAACNTVLTPAAGAATDRAGAGTDPGTGGAPAAMASSKKGAAARGAASNPFTADFSRRLARLAQWSESARALGIELPRVPAWAQEAASRATQPEAWAEVVRGIERLAQQQIVSALEAWSNRSKSRLARLEAYSVDSRLDRDQIEDTVHAARAGDISQAFVAHQQVDRVVTLKERHLDQARDEIERLVSFLKDISALGLEPPRAAADVGNELEAELRAGRLAPLKQQIRALRQEALNRLKRDLPKYVATNGDRLVQERARGGPSRAEAAELARGAHDVFQGRAEEGVRRLRTLRQPRGLTT